MIIHIIDYGEISYILVGFPHLPINYILYYWGTPPNWLTLPSLRRLCSARSVARPRWLRLFWAISPPRIGMRHCDSGDCLGKWPADGRFPTCYVIAGQFHWLFFWWRKVFDQTFKQFVLGWVPSTRMLELQRWQNHELSQRWFPTAIFDIHLVTCSDKSKWGNGGPRLSR